MTIDSPSLTQLPDLRVLWQEAFGDSAEFLDTFEKTAFSTDRCRCVTDGDSTVAALYWFDCIYLGRRIAYIYAVATAKTHRGRGICRMLMENTHLHLATLGYEATILVPGSRTLFDFYEKTGYRICSHIRQFECTAAKDKTALRRISSLEYAALRRRLLPRGAVIQEGESLAFLETQAVLYGGDGFLLAARQEGNKLYGIELLGDESEAPMIVRTLGLESGRFRTVGHEVPFAMYYPLAKSELPPPTYFGLAFD